ncbi:MAG: LamG-like jellyroll fold domain-containing protein [Kiritimatiellia bacterium]
MVKSIAGLCMLSLPLFADMVLHYKFENDLSDSSGSQAAATVVGALGYTSNMMEVAAGSAAVTLAGGANYMTLAQQINFSSSDLWSVAFWAKRGEIDAEHGMIMGDLNNNADFIWLNKTFKGFRFRSSDGNSLDFTVKQDLYMHHYALVVEGNGTMSLYVDGKLNANKNWSNTSFQVNAIGKAYIANTYNFQGVLDDVRIYTNKLDAADIYAIYTNNTLVQAVFDMDFENGLIDKSVAANNGTLQGPAAIATNDSMVTVGSKALKLDGSGSSYVSLDRKISFGASDKWSVIFRARRAALTTHGMILGERADDTNFIWLNDDFDGFRFCSSIKDTQHTADFISPKDTKLHHYALLADGTGKLDLYRDGAFDASVTLADTSFKIDSIGRAYSSNAYDLHGEIDDIKVYSGMVPPEYIQAEYAAGWNDNLLLHYTGDLDFSDQSLSENNGTGNGNVAIESSPSLVSVGTGSLTFDGADNSYIALNTPITFDTTNAWSVSFWAQRSVVGAGKGMVVGKLGNISDFIWLNDNFIGFGFRSSTGATVNFTTPMDTLLHHYTLVANGAGRITLYLDGALVSTQTGKNTSFVINAVGQAYPATTYHYAFQGQIDDFRVYSDALDANAVVDLYAMKSQAIAPSVTVTQLYVYLQGGQSNADGRAAPADLPTTPVNLQQPQTDVDFYYLTKLTYLYPATSSGTMFGPEITCGRSLTDQLNLDVSNRVAIIKYAVGGTTLHTDWIAGGDATTSGDGPRYVSFQQTVTAGLAALAAKYPDAKISIKGMTWMQGESDTASNSGSEAYYTNMTNLIADVRLTVGVPNMPFVIGRLSINQTSVNNIANLPVVRDAQSLADTSYHWVGLVDTDIFGLKTDHLHFDAAGQQSLGYGFADQLILLSKAQNTKGTLILAY